MVPVSYNIRNLIQRWPTTLMTALGIGMTVAVLITSLAMAEGLRTLFSASGDSRNALVLRKGTSAELTSSVAIADYDVVKNFDHIAKESGQPAVSREACVVANLPSSYSPDGMNISVRGLTPTGLNMRRYNITQGRMFSTEQRAAADAATPPNPPTPATAPASSPATTAPSTTAATAAGSSSKVPLREVIVGESIVQRYPDAALGKTVVFGKGAPWRVVGVFHSDTPAANSEIWCDLDQLADAFDRKGQSSSLLVRLDSDRDFDAFKKQVEGDQRFTLTVMKEKDYYAGQTQSGLPLEILGYSVAVIMAVGSAFAATNTMYAAVARRTREIGTLRALGFGKWSVMMSFMFESICLALVGGIIGVALALPINGITTGIGNFTTFTDVSFAFKVGLIPISAGLVFAAIIGAMGGFLPAYAASRKDIVQAMRDI